MVRVVEEKVCRRKSYDKGGSPKKWIFWRLWWGVKKKEGTNLDSEGQNKWES